MAVKFFLKNPVDAGRLWSILVQGVQDVQSGWVVAGRARGLNQEP